MESYQYDTILWIPNLVSDHIMAIEDRLVVWIRIMGRGKLGNHSHG